VFQISLKFEQGGFVLRMYEWYKSWDTNFTWDTGLHAYSDGVQATYIVRVLR